MRSLTNIDNVDVLIIIGGPRSGKTEYLQEFIRSQAEFNQSIKVFRPKLRDGEFNEYNASSFFEEISSTMMNLMDNDLKSNIIIDDVIKLAEEYREHASSTGYIDNYIVELFDKIAKEDKSNVKYIITMQNINQVIAESMLFKKRPDKRVNIVLMNTLNYRKDRILKILKLRSGMLAIKTLQDYTILSNKA